MTDRELLEWALAALDGYARNCGGGTCDAAEALRVRLARPEEPDWAAAGFGKSQREWQTLTENEIKHLWYEACQTNLELTSQLIVHLARNIEAKLKEKNAL